MSKAVCYFGSYDPDYARNRIIIKGLRVSGVEIYQCQASGLIFSRYLKLLKCFLKYKDQYQTIIIGFPGHYDVPLAFILGKLFGKKVFYDIFASNYETYVLDREIVKKKSFRSNFFYFIDWLSIKLADYVIVDTITHGKFYSQCYGLNPQNQIVVYVGSDTDYFYPRKVKEETDVLFYGSYQPLQGVDVIIKAASKLPKVKFKLIGEGQTRRSVESQAKDLKLKNVEFVDWLPLEKLAEEISKAKICLGIFGTTQKANIVIPNKVYDYLATAKPVITRNSNAAKEILTTGVNAALIKEDENKDLAKAIADLIKNTARRDEIRKAGRRLFREKLKPKLLVRNLVNVIAK